MGKKMEAKIKIGENKSKSVCIFLFFFLSNAPEINAALKKVNVKT